MRPALSDYPHLASGKVRELYRVDDEHLLLVATDRISAYDYVLDSTIPDKGRILTAMRIGNATTAIASSTASQLAVVSRSWPAPAMSSAA